MAVKDLIARLRLNAKDFQKGLKRSEKKASKFGQNMKRIGGVIAGAFAFHQIARGIRSVISANVDFEKSMSTLSSITGATGKDLEFYGEQAREIGKTTTLSASQAVEGFKLMGSARPELLKNRDALAAVTKEAVILAEASGLELPVATQALAKAMNQFQVPAEKASDVINTLAAGSKFGAEAIPGIADAIKVMGTSANQANISLEQSVAAIETLAEKGLSGSESGTQLRNVILKLQSEADHLNPKIVGLQTALENLGKENLSAAELTKMFGLRNQQAAAILVENRDKLKQYTAQVSDTNTAYEQARINVDNVEGAYKSFQSAIEALMLKFQQNKDALKNLVLGLRNFVNLITENIDTIVRWVKALGTGAAVFFGTKGLISGFVLAKKGVRAFRGSFRKLNATMKANVIILIISLIASLIMWVTSAWKENYKFRAVVQNVWEDVMLFIKKAFVNIKFAAKIWFFGMTSYFKGIIGFAKATGKAIAAIFKKGESPRDAFKREMKATKKALIDKYKEINKERSDEIKKLNKGNKSLVQWKAEAAFELDKKQAKEEGRDAGQAAAEAASAAMSAQQSAADAGGGGGGGGGGGTLQITDLTVDEESINEAGNEISKQLTDQISNESPVKIESPPVIDTDFSIAPIISNANATDNWYKKLMLLGDALDRAKEKYGENSDEANLLKEKIDKIKEAHTAELAALDQLRSGLSQGAESWQEYGNNVLNTIKNVISGYLAKAVAGQISALAGAGPLGVALAAAGAGAVKTLFNTMVPSFAEGGMVTGPTLAMVGDNPSGKEYMIPEEKMNKMGGGAVEVTGTTRIEGSDLVTVFERATAKNKRK